MITGVHAVLYARDAEATRAFLQDVFGFDSVDAGGGFLIFALPLGASGSRKGALVRYRCCPPLTLLEVLVVPYRAGDLALANRYEAHLMHSRGVFVREIDLAQYVPQRSCVRSPVRALRTRCNWQPRSGKAARHS